MNKPTYYRCGICDSLHPIDWNADCRDDANRLAADQLDAKHGPLGWQEVEMPSSEPSPAPFWTVGIYLIDRSYGGPEEGGWWYQTGERIDHELENVAPAMLTIVIPDAAGRTGELGAQNFARIVQERLDATVNVGRRDIGSVLSTGRYQAEVYNGHPPKHYPETRPHYE